MRTAEDDRRTPHHDNVTERLNNQTTQQGSSLSSRLDRIEDNQTFYCTKVPRIDFPSSRQRSFLFNQSAAVAAAAAAQRTLCTQNYDIAAKFQYSPNKHIKTDDDADAMVLSNVTVIHKKTENATLRPQCRRRRRCLRCCRFCRLHCKLAAPQRGAFQHVNPHVCTTITLPRTVGSSFVVDFSS